MLELRDPMVRLVTLETVDHQDSRDNEVRRAREVTRELKDTLELTDPRYVCEQHAHSHTYCTIVSIHCFHPHDVYQFAVCTYNWIHI